MIDVVSPKTRSAMMAGIKSRNTKPELKVRKALFSQGYRFRLHRKDLPGSPDILLPRRNLAIFVNGCFWHGHTGCKFAKLPTTRPEFWETKLARTRDRDFEAISALGNLGWRVLVVWECFVRKQTGEQDLGIAISRWIDSGQVFGELSNATLPNL